ncbi:MAG: CotH kinase family protein [Sphingobacteriaceae bacterium]
MKKYILYFFLAFAIGSCQKDKAVITKPEPEVPQPPKEDDSVNLLTVTLEAKLNPGKLTEDVYCKIDKDKITALIPSFESNKKLVVTFTTKNANVTASDTVLVSGKTLIDYSKVVNYKLTSAKGTTKTYSFAVKNFTGIPILYLNTTQPILSKDDYVAGTVSVNTNFEYNQEQQRIGLQAKGRGNSTWGMPKKPYRLKFDDKASMLEMQPARNWVLLANYSDKTLMRTSLAFSLGQKLGADFTFMGRFVELVLNGEYVGSYYLTSQVEVNENRVNIKELKKGDNAPDLITGGYLLEFDQRRDEANRFETNQGMPFTIKSPDKISTEQFTYIKSYLQKVEDVLASDGFSDVDTGYNKYINSESFINWFIVQELFKNQDAKDFSSIYYYKDRNGKLGMGPLWDFDLAAGNVDYSDARYPTGWWIKDGPMFKILVKDPIFKQKLKSRWNAAKAKEVKEMIAQIADNMKYLQLSQQKNFERWKIIGVYVWPNPIVFDTYQQEVSYIKNWLTERSAWLDENINQL